MSAPDTLMSTELMEDQETTLAPKAEVKQLVAGLIGI